MAQPETKDEEVLVVVESGRRNWIEELWIQGRDLAMGEHKVFSRYVPIAFLLADAVICSLVIWKVPCESFYPPVLSLSHTLLANSNLKTHLQTPKSIGKRTWNRSPNISRASAIT